MDAQFIDETKIKQFPPNLQIEPNVHIFNHLFGSLDGCRDIGRLCQVNKKYARLSKKYYFTKTYIEPCKKMVEYSKLLYKIWAEGIMLRKPYRVPKEAQYPREMLHGDYISPSFEPSIQTRYRPEYGSHPYSRSYPENSVEHTCVWSRRRPASPIFTTRPFRGGFDIEPHHLWWGYPPDKSGG